jgi:hypothetical protein
MRALLVLLVSLVAGLVGLAAVEILARLTEGFGCQNETASVATRNRYYGWGHIPGSSGWAQRCLNGKPEFRTFVRINGQGLHDREIPYARTAAQRILVLGDSFVEAFQVDFEESFVKRLEASLNAPDSPGARVEVVNAGVSGWGTDNSLLWFQTEGWRYRPDVVMLVFNTGNDVFENDRALITFSSIHPDKPYFRLVDGRLVRTNYPLPEHGVVKQWVLWIYHVLEPYSAVVRRISNVPAIWEYLQSPPAREPGAPPANPWQVYLKDYPEHWTEGWRITRGLVLRLRQVVEAHGARFVVVVLNGREEVSPARMETAVRFHPDLAAGVDADKPNRLITRFLARRGIATIPLLDGFRAKYSADAKPAYFDWDVHWAPPGHALAATLIERGLVAQGFVHAPAAKLDPARALAPGDDFGP